MPARKKRRLKRGGDWQRLDLEEVHLAVDAAPDGLLAVNEALEDFAREDPAKAELVKLRFFAGLSLPQAAQTLGLSLSTAKRSWAFARAWLYRRLNRAGDLLKKVEPFWRRMTFGEVENVVPHEHTKRANRGHLRRGNRTGHAGAAGGLPGTDVR